MRQSGAHGCCTPGTDEQAAHGVLLQVFDKIQGRLDQALSKTSPKQTEARLQVWVGGWAMGWVWGCGGEVGVGGDWVWVWVSGQVWVWVWVSMRMSVGRWYRASGFCQGQPLLSVVSPSVLNSIFQLFAYSLWLLRPSSRFYCVCSALIISSAAGLLQSSRSACLVAMNNISTNAQGITISKIRKNTQ